MNEQANPSAVTPHPLAGNTLSGADTVVQVLADEGVDTVFGYSGGAILPIYDAVFRYNDHHAQPDTRPAMQLVVPANEQGAGFMAAGYARASGKVGVVMVTSGPGATNTVTPVRDSMADSVPLVVICGQVPTAAIGTDAFQEAPVAALMGAVAKHVFLVTDAEKLEETVRSAFELARTGRPGPVVVDIPKDIQNWQGPFKGSGTLPLHGYRRRLAAVEANTLGDNACERFYTMLSESERPLIYAGGGVINAKFSDSTMIIPKWIGSMPRLLTAMGCRIGPKIMRAAAISINMPTISMRIRIRSKMICGLLLTLRKPAATDSGTRSMVKIQPRIDADPIIRNTTPVVLPV